MQLTVQLGLLLISVASFIHRSQMEQFLSQFSSVVLFYWYSSLEPCCLAEMLLAVMSLRDFVGEERRVQNTSLYKTINQSKVIAAFVRTDISNEIEYFIALLCNSPSSH